MIVVQDQIRSFFVYNLDLLLLLHCFFIFCLFFLVSFCFFYFRFVLLIFFFIYYFLIFFILFLYFTNPPTLNSLALYKKSNNFSPLCAALQNSARTHNCFL